MTVTFKPLRYGDMIDAVELYQKINDGEADILEVIDLYSNWVASWDYADIETGEVIPINQPRLLSIEQIDISGKNLTPK